MAVDFRLAPSAEDGRQILHMDRICFPVDEPPSIAGAEWVIGWDGEMPAAYCAWKTVEHDGVPVGFHYRGGVLPEYRGHGLQRQMLRLREARMREQGLTVAVTYTDADGAASMRSLIAEGYRPYVPTATTTLSGLGRLGRVGFVHWRKSLQMPPAKP
ncbi:N-acetyltransferase family protein [Reyranella sp.]|uniref:GNAT family N-acetyltransferase n=1 Tax=Reyranella sp. TaxID=1929291 RepID=UPI003D0BDDCC